MYPYIIVWYMNMNVICNMNEIVHDGVIFLKPVFY